MADDKPSGADPTVIKLLRENLQTVARRVVDSMKANRRDPDDRERDAVWAWKLEEWADELDAAERTLGSALAARAEPRPQPDLRTSVTRVAMHYIRWTSIGYECMVCTANVSDGPHDDECVVGKLLKLTAEDEARVLVGSPEAGSQQQEPNDGRS